LESKFETSRICTTSIKAGPRRFHDLRGLVLYIGEERE